MAMPEGAKDNSLPDRVESSGQKRPLVMPVGTLMTEAEPHIFERIVTGEKYDGVRMPFDMARAQGVMNQIASDEGTTYTILQFGSNHLIKRYGAEKARDILLGHGNDEEKAFLNAIIEREKIRSAIHRAIPEVLEHEAFQGVESVLIKMMDEEAYRDDILGRAAELEDDLVEKEDPKDERLIDFLGMLRVFRQVLPRGMPTGRKSSNPEELRQELRYLTGEAAVICNDIASGSSIVTFQGSDIKPLDTKDGTRKLSITEILREVMAARFPELNINEVNWRTMEELDGLAMIPGQSGGIRSRRAPYYDSNGNGSEMAHMIPYDTTFVERCLLKEGYAGLQSGHAEEIVRQGLNPVLVKFVRNLQAIRVGTDGVQKPKSDWLTREFTFKAKDLVEWAEETDDAKRTPMPKQFNLSDFERLFQRFCTTVYQRTQKILHPPDYPRPRKPRSEPAAPLEPPGEESEHPLQSGEDE